MKKAINQVASGQNLSMEEAKRATDIMLSGEATQAQIGGFLTALRMKGETREEIAGCAASLGEKAVHINPRVEKYIDIVGTGGDGSNSFNISTTSAFVLAGAGLAVAKHGNRSLSSKCGAGDVLEVLGLNITTEPAKVEKAIEDVGIGFMFAQTFNPSMRFVGKTRVEMGIRTVFNVLGPLANPSNAPYQLIGVYSQDMTELICSAVKDMGILKGCMVVSSETNMDEISASCATTISELRDGVITTYQVTPEQFGFPRCAEEELLGGTAEENAAITLGILSGKEQGAKRNAVLLNAGAALYLCGLAETMEAGIALAVQSIDSGKALAKLKELVEYCK